ncbi:hypothetical protein DRJ48_02850 [Candidatus Woesearchaeota archaeon]|nr:MAG: hypothetical protein DRJ48_02850 [Candidatus Woesearchaeota archaeon]
MSLNRDYLSYVIGGGGLFLTLLSFFKEVEQKVIFLIWGAAAVIISVVMIYIDQYTSRIERVEKDLNKLKNELSYSKQLLELKKEIEYLKMNKRGKANTDIIDIFKVVILIIILFLILKALGVI